LLPVLLVPLVLLDFTRAPWRAAHDTSGPWNPRYAPCALEERAGARWLREHDPGRSPVIVAETSHGALFLERPALRLPFTDAAVDTLRHRFGARWLVLTDREAAAQLPHWLAAPPAWAHRVWRAGPSEYAPEAVAAGYRHASPVSVFALDPVAGGDAPLPKRPARNPALE
jgi:hypothetical protein